MGFCLPVREQILGAISSLDTVLQCAWSIPSPGEVMRQICGSAFGLSAISDCFSCRQMNAPATTGGQPRV